MNAFFKMLRDESGASAAEYALILAIVGTAIAGAAILLGNTISASITDASTCISTAGADCPDVSGEGEEPPVEEEPEV